LLLAIMFWTSLWGMVGLVLATPMTVCLSVLGKYVPPLQLLVVLLGSQPALKAGARYYQRLLARDRYEAEAVIKDYLDQHPIDSLYDEVLIPALVLARRGRRGGELQPEDEQFILRTTRQLLEDLDRSMPPALTPPDAGRLLVMGFPACDEVDELALLMLQHVCKTQGHDVRLHGSGDQSSGMIALVQQERPDLVFISALGPGGLAQARYLCQRLHSQLPTLRVVVGRWGHRRSSRKSRKLLLHAGADRIVTTIHEGCGQLTRLNRTPVRLQGTT
jgi:hypothetical protein